MRTHRFTIILKEKMKKLVSQTLVSVTILWKIGTTARHMVCIHLPATQLLPICIGFILISYKSFR